MNTPKAKGQNPTPTLNSLRIRRRVDYRHGSREEVGDIDPAARPGSTATPRGPSNTGMVAVTEFVAVSITETVFEPVFAT
jgi:hypothetical protein